MANETRPAFSNLNLTTILCGIPVVGTAQGNYLEITPDTDIANNAVDVDGAVYTNLIANNMATGRFRTQYGNPANDLLNVVAITFRTTGAFAPTAVTVISGLGTILNTITSASSNIMRFPTDVFSQEASAMTREWTFKLHNVLRA